MAVLECCLVFPLIAWTAFAQQGKQEAPPPYVPQNHRPGLFFREDFMAAPPGVHIAADGAASTGSKFTATP